MIKLKRTLALLLAAVMLLSLCACGSKEPEAPAAAAAPETTAPAETAAAEEALSEVTPVEETPVEEAPAETAPAASVRPAMQFTNAVIDDYVELKEEGTLTDIPSTYRLPGLKKELPASAEYDQWLKEMFENWKQLRSWFLQWIDADSADLSYQTGVYNDILVITMHTNGHQGVGRVNDSFAIDLRTGKKMDMNNLISRCGGSREQIDAYLLMKLQEYFDSEDKSYGQVEGAEELRKQNMSPDVLHRAQFEYYAHLNELAIKVDLLYYVDESTHKATPYNNLNGLYFYEKDIYNMFELSSVAAPAAAPAGANLYSMEDVAQFISLGSEGTEAGTEYSLPALTLDGSASAEFSQWVQNVLGEWKRSISWYQSVYEVEDVKLGYKSGIYNDILSVTMTVGEKFPVNGWPYSETFSIDLRTGEQLTMDRFLELNNISWEKMEAYLLNGMTQYAKWEREDYPNVSGLEDMLNKIMSSENLRQSEVVLDALKDGQVVLNVHLPYYVDSESGQIREYGVPNIYCIYVSDLKDIG